MHITEPSQIVFMLANKIDAPSIVNDAPIFMVQKQKLAIQLSLSCDYRSYLLLLC